MSIGNQRILALKPLSKCEKTVKTSDENSETFPSVLSSLEETSASTSVQPFCMLLCTCKLVHAATPLIKPWLTNKYIS